MQEEQQEQEEEQHHMQEEQQQEEQQDWEQQQHHMQEEQQEQEEEQQEEQEEQQGKQQKQKQQHEHEDQQQQQQDKNQQQQQQEKNHQQQHEQEEQQEEDQQKKDHMIRSRALQDWEEQPTFGHLNPTQLSSSGVLSSSRNEQGVAGMLLQGLEAQALNRQLVAAVVLNKWSIIEALAYTLQQYSERVVGWEVGREEGEYELVPFANCCGNMPREFKLVMQNSK